MRFPRMRFTVRWMMFMVAIVALLLGTSLMIRRRSDRLRMVDFHANLERKSTIFLERLERDAAKARAAGDFEPFNTGPFRIRAMYFKKMRQKWKRGSARPWEAVEDDPPQPQLFGNLSPAP
jgi:hypothetical protein